MNGISDASSILSDSRAQDILPYEADDSPFPEVRAVVKPVDDRQLPVNTVRMWVIGMVFTIVCCLPPTAMLQTIERGNRLLFLGRKWLEPIL